MKLRFSGRLRTEGTAGEFAMIVPVDGMPGKVQLRLGFSQDQAEHLAADLLDWLLTLPGWPESSSFFGTTRSPGRVRIERQ